MKNRIVEFNENISITESNAAEWESKLVGDVEISGAFSIHSAASFAKLTSLKVGADFYIDSALKPKLVLLLWSAGYKQKWYLTDRCSEWLLAREGNIEYRINAVAFDKTLFDKVRRDELTAQEVFALSNMEQRRVAYEKMNKSKMSALPNLKVLDEVKDDGHGYPMKIVSFTVTGFDKPFRYLNCFCPSGGREYYLETQQDTCQAAKGMSFGDENIKFDQEW